MKKLVLSLAAVLTFGLASAQETKFGVKAGVGLTNLAQSGKDSDGVDSPDSKLGVQFGAFAEIKLDDKFAFQPELLFSTQGAKSKESVSSTGYSYSSETKLNFSYINVPLMMKYYATEKFSLEFGPQVGFLMSAKAKTDSSTTILGTTESTSTNEDVKKFYNSTDFGLNIGAGYNFTDNLSAGLRYNLGLSNVYKEQSGEDYKLKNRVISLQLGYRF
ncbi:porin family protein [Flavobacterium croceum]|uniref:Outer membrane protein with beta-barrel domain n=1 Tax=Flavobacterium croceum DSM 17960 TaxID=1121886 RepID=A0A2S4N8X0_9FLAO|nr:porin family protein [Flavobacterium croceum]POS02144.1 outer membrane protein with beta-barrel domain [Flavobacterium croceum DSM 17960]